MPVIDVRELSKNFQIMKREPGFLGALSAFFVRHYTNVEAVKKINFVIKEGELVGFLGPNGAGKTTTLKMIAGLLHPTAGSLQTLNCVPAKRPRELLNSLTLVMGNRSQLWWEIPVEDSLLLNKEIYELNDAFYHDSLNELTELLEIKDLLRVPVKKLSLGQRMKAEFCAALLHRPKLLLLDEPTLGLDVVMQKKIRQFLLNYNERHKATILLTSHNMEDVLELCQRVLIIHKGNLIYDGGLKDVVNRYAPTKRVTVDFAQQLSQEQLQSFGFVAPNGTNYKATLETQRDQISQATARILEASGKTLPAIVDLTIEEPPIEDVVRQIFEEG